MAAVIRPAGPEDAEGMVRVHGDAWRAAYRGIVPDAFLEGVGREPDAVERRRRWAANPKAVCLVAEEGGGVVGFSIGGPPREIPPGFDAELALIYVHPGSQGRGVGRRLFEGTAAALAARGARSLALRVLRDNAPGRAFYERLGGVLLGEKEIAIGGARLVAVAYGWSAIRSPTP